MFFVAVGFAASQMLVTTAYRPAKANGGQTDAVRMRQGPRRIGTRPLLDKVLLGRRHLPIVRYRSFVHDPVRRGVQEPDRRAEKLAASHSAAIAFVEILVFIATLVVGYIYVWKKGTFDWGLQARAEARAEAKEMARRNREIRMRKAADISDLKASAEII